MRTWTLRIDDSPWGEDATVVIPPFTAQAKDQPLVRVIELEPVLDLLERLIGEDVLCLPDDQQNDPEAMGTALLRAHGRLDG